MDITKRSGRSNHLADGGLPLQAARGRRVGPTNDFVEFKKGEIEQSIPERFEQQVRRYPDRLAVKSEDHALTYGALNKAANRLAWAILTKCGKEAEPIALLFEPGLCGIASILGALKTGKSFASLDPSFPRARLTYMLEDSQAGLIVTSNRNLLLARELARSRCPVLNIDEPDSSLSTENPALSISADSLAYILYTSGSTGQPKGVFQNHRNELHRIMTYINGFRIRAEDRLTLLYSPSVGAALRDSFSALLNGAALFPFHVKEQGLDHLANWLIREEITIYNSFTTTFRHFAGTLTGEKLFPKIRMVGLGGEATYEKDIELCRRHFSPECLVYVGLATTETGSITRYFIDKETDFTSGYVPAGYAVEDKEIFLLDGNGKEVGFNRIGEIAVKSCYLACGYWRRPDLTQTAFLPDPEGGDERFYCTGDLGFMLPDGCLVPVGRKDFQVKVRGYRVEVAEVEMALLNLDNIREAVVVAREDREGDQRLIGYLVPVSHPAPSFSTMRRLLAENLPDYMIPSGFLVLDSLPRTANGKVDRRALPTPEKDRPDLDHPFVAPRTPIEEVLAGLWSKILGVEQVGIDDNFFELGGHSLLATQIISRIRTMFQVEVRLRTLFEKPTIEKLAKVIAQSQANGVE